MLAQVLIAEADSFVAMWKEGARLTAIVQYRQRCSVDFIDASAEQRETRLAPDQ
jgi:ABC-type thiamine transport system substrate-binding protein